MKSTVYLPFAQIRGVGLSYSLQCFLCAATYGILYCVRNSYYWQSNDLRWQKECKNLPMESVKYADKTLVPSQRITGNTGFQGD